MVADVHVHGGPTLFSVTRWSVACTCNIPLSVLGTASRNHPVDGQLSSFTVEGNDQDNTAAFEFCHHLGLRIAGGQTPHTGGRRRRRE
jgi:hypothetical protein